MGTNNYWAVKMILQNMPEEQDTDLTPEDTSEDNPLEEHSVEQEKGEQSDDKGAEDTSQPVKIGEKEYTPEQIAEIEKKASGYDTLLPDYTRKSQKLAEFEKGQPEQPSPEEPFYRKDGWQPKDYNELQKAIITAEERGEKKAVEALQKVESQREEAKGRVDSFVEEVKGQDKEFDEDDFFKYVQGHKFSVNSMEDLKAVYSAYKEVREAGIKGEENARKNILERGKEAIAGPKAGKGTPFSVGSQEIRKSGSAYEAVMDAYNKIKK